MPDAKVKKNILIGDDVANIRMMFKNSLEAKYHILLASDGQEILTTFKNRPDLDLLVIDLKLPDTDGIKVIKAIRSKNLDLPIIIITGYPTTENIMESKMLNVQGFYNKPFNIDVICKKIDSILSPV